MVNDESSYSVMEQRILLRHTGVVVYGHEYYLEVVYNMLQLGQLQIRLNIRVVDLGVTGIPKDVFEMYLQEMSPRYTADL